MKFKVLLFVAGLCPLVMNAQNAPKIQFVGGINWSNLRLSKPIPENANFVERYSQFSGYQAGIKVEFGRDEDSDELGFSLPVEVLIAQTGANYHYYGPSYQNWAEGESVTSKGTVETKLEIANTYLKLPISLSINVNQHFSLQLGGYAAYLIQSKGSGTMNYNGNVTISKKTPPYSRLDLDTFKIKPFQTALNFNYLDEFDTGIIRMGDSSLCSANAALGLRPTQLGAYYDRNGRSGLMFNRLDLGIHAGIQLEAGGWFIAARVSYGLSDVLNNNY
ncbi:MAG: hypothetical protein RLZZ628_3787, partial [Bacteroidota bacterium]